MASPVGPLKDQADCGQLFHDSRLADAEVCFQQTVRQAPELAGGWYQLGLVRAARGHYKDAVDAQRLAVAHAHHFGQAYCALALDLRETGQGPDALQMVNKAIELLPTYAGAWNLRANLKQDLGDFDGAAADYAQALRLAPNYAGAWFNRAQLQEKRRQKDEAYKSYSNALKVKPNFAEAWLARAELNLDRHALNAADIDFRTVTHLSGSEPEAWWGLARVAKARHAKAEAADCLVRYKSAVRRRDRRLVADLAAGLEKAAVFEPGLPLASSQAASLIR